MKYFLTSGSRKLQVEIDFHAPSTYHLQLEEALLEADLVDVDQQGQYAARIGARSFAVAIEKGLDQELQVTIAGECFVIKAVDEREQAAGALASARPKAENINAAMPGIVVEVRVAVGDHVDPGQAVLVLEAMKMQNEVCATHGGVVAELCVDAGQTVATGAPLVRLKESTD